MSLSPNAPLPPPESGSSGVKIPILFGAVLALIAANVYLFMKLEENKAEVAKARGKTVAGLVAALVADEKKELQAAVSSGRITQAQADEHLANAEARFTDLVNGTLPEGGRHGFGGPPAKRFADA